MVRTPNLSSQQPLSTADPAAQSVLVLRQFRVLFNAVRSHFQQVEKTVGIGGALVWALSVIKNQPGIGVTDLACAMDVHQSTASNLVRQLLKKELIRSERSTVDRRNVHLFVQPAAVTLLAGVPGPYEGVLPQALQQLSPATLLQLQKNLASLIEVLQVDEQAGQIPLAQI